MNEQQIRAIIQDELEKYGIQNQYKINTTAIHTHNGTDSVQMPLSSIEESISIPANTGSVFNANTLNGQPINNLPGVAIGNPNPKNPQTVYTLPVNIIYGFGVGNQGAFGGGFAKQGTMIFFENAGLSTLWIYTLDGWKGCSFPLTD